ncbi:helix-turn-helix domain-containing protein [Providencia rettgeri]|uniref:helix-turn-helix domain-containing protein n=1 Tax=Providencia rettgeri TaxID=587 RepID=UPI001B395FB6|nr:helix-turn-helix domain-containing protein [Providencia rettgeri]EHZ7763050.1 helix-turn-helix domain-containing protein [Providencia rettgeri]EIJ7166192.1 helix-turn-helix domain-containing protein [Providencia rettgeri]EJD6046015.1 helix-turn-helix domain-containing protein [Providencia rettgeri]ELR5103959.1 helix-turn-helix domain-containing protein [Providencia rettgeri]ELR5279118.1 helix-turn-helix domain-containing protein [Providencia rettgeri]
MEDDSLFTVKEYAALLKLSESTVYRNPAKYHMFRVGSSWRASKESLKRFEQAQFDNNLDSSAVLTHKRQKKLNSKNIYEIRMQRDVAKELNRLLAKDVK